MVLVRTALFKTTALLLCCSFIFLSIPDRAHADVFLLKKDSTLIGTVQEYRVKDNESLIEIARRFNLGYNEIVDANPDLDPFVPKNGSSVLIPSSWILPDSSRNGIVINISEMRLYYFYKKSGKDFVRTYPIGIGDDGKETPTGRFRIIEKIKNPPWRVPESIRKERPELPNVVPPGPDNPLGSHALRLSLGSYLIHGTNRPWAVGRKVTHGCLRLYPEDIPELFNVVPVGAPVTIVRQPVKVGLNNGRVYIEVHRDEHWKDEDYLNEATRLLKTKNLIGRINSEKLYQAIMEMSGSPTVISD
ncbi:MAG: L,D-transpeptidase family protein [Thermodesulfovibrionales bacterium]